MKTRRGPAALLAAVLLALVGPALVPADSAGAIPAKATTTTTAPKGEWDARIEPIAKEVAKLRKLDFEHPVPVQFLAGKEFDKKVTVDSEKLTKQQKRASAESTARLAAIGLVPHASNLVEQQNQLQSSSVLALYLPSKKKVFVRGTDLDSPAKKVTVAHELTHALQDQHFDLQKLGKEAEKTHSTDAYKAVVEGDAVRVQDLYAKTLSQADQDQYKSENTDAAQQADAESTSADVAPALQAFLEAPYVFGPPMLQTVQAAKGESAIDGLFRNPPTNDLAYVLPTSLLDKTKIAKVAPPAVSGKGEKRFGTADTFGSYALYLMLSQQLDPTEALKIADGWGGDALVDYKVGTGKDAQQCVRAAFVGQNADATEAIQQGLETWAAAQPAGSAKVARRDGKVVFSSCDVTDARPTQRDPKLALTILATRDQLIGSYAEQGAPTGTARCAADGVVNDPAVRPVLEQGAADPTAEPDAATTAAIQTAVQQIIASCVRTGKASSAA